MREHAWPNGTVPHWSFSSERGRFFRSPIAERLAESRFFFGQRRSKQSFKVVNWSDALLSGEFLERGRGGALRSGSLALMCLLLHDSRITGQIHLSVSVSTAYFCDRRFAVANQRAASGIYNRLGSPNFMERRFTGGICGRPTGHSNQSGKPIRHRLS
jgi:hypothetical protein